MNTKIMNVIPTRWALAASVILLVSNLGCGSDNPGHHAVSGEITMDGKPLEQGTITLIPTDKGSPASGTIVDGQFQIPAYEGPEVGSYLVEIHSVRATGRNVPDSDHLGTIIEETRDVVPARYNRDSKLVVEVKAEAENRLTLALESRAPGKAKRR